MHIDRGPILQSVNSSYALVPCPLAKNIMVRREHRSSDKSFPTLGRVDALGARRAVMMRQENQACLEYTG